MKLKLSLLKLIIRLLIIMIIFVMLFMVSLTLYSTKYWSDVYNYINANITIKRIPTITELNYVVIEVKPTEEYTEYTTTDNYDGESTVDFDTDGELTLDDIDFEKKKRSIEDDYSEVPIKTVRVDYFFDLGEPKLIKDLIGESELTTRTDDVEMLAGDFGVKGRSMEASNFVEELSLTVFPWVAAIFVKNTTSDQFNYYCDGGLLSKTAVVTAASCVQNNNSAVKTEDLIVLFGKTSLKTVGDKETVARIKSIMIHEDFTGRNQGHDLAILITEEPVIFGDAVQAAALGSELEEKQLATTGWATTGELTPILLETKDKVACDEATSEDTVCAVYGNDITVCPSYGGLYVAKQVSWHLHGIRTGNPEDRGLCVNRNIAFTSLYSHWDWIKLHTE